MTSDNERPAGGVRCHIDRRCRPLRLDGIGDCFHAELLNEGVSYRQGKFPPADEQPAASAKSVRARNGCIDHGIERDPDCGRCWDAMAADEGRMVFGKSVPPADATVSKER